LRVILNGRRRTGHLELEATEMLVCSAMHHAGATVLTKLLQFPTPAAGQRTIACCCGHSAHYRELRSKPVLTVVGMVEVSRPYYLCLRCHTGHFPADVELDIENREFSPGVRRMQAVVGQEAPFDHGRQQMKLLADLEALGCAFTQTTWDKEGYPIRNPDSTTYVGAIEPAEEFGKRLYVEAWKRDWSHAGKKGVMGDGAEWIWNLAEPYFPGAVQIVDLFHARQHLWELARKLYPNDAVNQKAWIKVHQRRLLDKGKIEKLVLGLRSIVSTNLEVVEKIRIEADYFERNAERMRYPKFRRQHLFVGSGVIEAGCKTVIGSRLKQSGMFWTVRGANAIIALRCCHLNNRFEDYWGARRPAA
jgi:hypothetical protein